MLLYSVAIAQPKIARVRPTASMPGDTLIVSGSAFGTNAGDIKVKMQSLMLDIVSVSDTAIRVVAAPGISFGRLEVIKDGLIAESNLPVVVGNRNSTPANISLSQFVSGPSYTTNDSAQAAATADFNSDGLLDLVLASGKQNRLLIFQNNSTATEVRFGNNIPVLLGDKALIVEIADLDADSKPDIIATSASQARIYVLRNTSQASGLSFDAPLVLTTGSVPLDIATIDFDDDGKLDMAVTNSNTNSVSLFRNQSAGSSLSFIANALVVGSPQATVAAGDIDKDGKADLVVGLISEFMILRNVTTGATPQFQQVERKSAATNIYEVAVLDFNDDGWLDLFFSGSTGSPVLFRNTGTGVAGNLFQYFKAYNIPSTGFISVADFNADLLPDFVVNSTGASGAYFGVQNNFQADPYNNQLTIWSTSQRVTSLNGVDINKDGKADLLLTGHLPDLAVMLNNQPSVSISDFTPKTAGRGTKVLISGSGLQNVTAVLFGNVACDSFKVISPNFIEAYPGAGATGSLRVQTATEMAEVSGFVFVDKPQITRFTPDTGYFNATISIIGKRLQTTKGVIIDGTWISSFTVVSDTMVNVLVDSVGSGQIKLVTIGGTDSISGFVYYPRPRLYGSTTFQPAPGASIDIRGKWFRGIQTLSLAGYPISNYVSSGDSLLQINVPNNYFGGALVIQTKYGHDSLPGFYNGAETVVADSFIVVPGSSVRVRVPDLAKFNSNAIFFVNGAKGLVTANGPDWVDLKVPFGLPSLSVDARLGGIHKKVAPQQIGVSNLRRQEFDNLPFEKSNRLFTNNENPVSGLGYFDVDGDHLTDIIDLSGFSVGKITIFRSRGIPGLFAFDTIVTSIPATASMKVSPFLADLDNNGLNELILSIGGYGTYCFENQSTAGTIKLVDKGIICHSVVQAVSDLDGDGWQDLVALAENGNGFICFQNQSNRQPFQFGAGQSFNGFSLEGPVRAEDLNRDGRPELLFRNTTLYKNGSIPGHFKFEPGGRVTNDPIDGNLLLDMNSDGSSELLVFDRSNRIFTVYRNSSAGDYYSFMPTFQLPISSDAFTWNAGDLNGDGKPEVCLLYINAKQLVLLKNTSDQTNIAFEMVPGVTLYDAVNPFGTVTDFGISDFDADGYPDVATLAVNSATLRLYRNVVGRSSQINTCVGAPFSIASNVIGTNFRWQVSVDGVSYVDLTNNQMYTGVASSQLMVSGLDANAYGSYYRCVVDNVPQKGTQVLFRNAFTGAVNSDWQNAANWSCGSVPTGMVDVIVNKPVTINSNVTVRSITIMPGATVTIAQGNTITLLQ
jgi:hypothetical protein